MYNKNILKSVNKLDFYTTFKSKILEKMNII